MKFINLMSYSMLQIGSLQIIFCLYTQLSEVVESWMPGIVLNIPHIC